MRHSGSHDFLRINRDEYVDPVWRALRATLHLAGKAQAYSNRADEFLRDLRAHKLFVEDQDRYWRLHPRLRARAGTPVLGDYISTQIGQHRVTVFASDLRLNNDGPTMPAARLLTQLLAEAQPRLVLYVGLGGGMTATHQAGDVAVASRARYNLRGDLEGSVVNNQTYGGAWAAPGPIFDDIRFAPLREPALMPASPHYEQIPNPQPAQHQPIVRLENLPIMTAPRLTEDFFDIPTPDVGEPSYWGDVACAVDMDAAPVAAACGVAVPCALVVGHATPPIKRLRYDFDGSLRRGWAEHMFNSFAVEAANNAAIVVARIIDRT
jgi:nucleoside phosphorylase